MDVRSTVRRGTRAAQHALRDPRWAGELLHLRPSRAPRVSAPAVALAPADALRENGFAVFRGLFSPQQCATLAAQLKAEAGITEGEHYTRTDATNRFTATRRVLFDERLLAAVRSAVQGDVRFLQVSDLHYLHDTAGWHRDSVHRAQDNSQAADWRDDGEPFGIVKAIVYLESTDAAMGLIPGSHASPIGLDRVRTKMIEKRHGQLVVDLDAEPNRRFSDEQRRFPLAWKSMPGDVLVFDQRTYHAGRRVVDGQVSDDRLGAKFTLSLVFGLDNHHSERFYSYFRYARRELGYRPPNPQLYRELEQHGLLLTNGLGNYYEQHPDELRLAALRKPETMDDLVAEFARAGQQRRPLDTGS